MCDAVVGLTQWHGNPSVHMSFGMFALEAPHPFMVGTATIREHVFVLGSRIGPVLAHPIFAVCFVVSFDKYYRHDRLVPTVVVKGHVP